MMMKTNLNSRENKPEYPEQTIVNRLRTVDTSYRERRRIVRLLDFLTREQLTRDQMERIGRSLQKSPRRALPPLVRRLWREQDYERLYRYACMLDFFDSTTWLDQLVSLTLKRQDLADEGRMPLLQILQDYGIDVSSPPFSRGNLNTATINSFLDTCLEEGTWGLVRFMDSFLFSEDSLRNHLITRLGSRCNHKPEAAACLRMLAYFEYSEVSAAAIENLGRLRHGSALTVLNSLKDLTVEGLEPLIARSIRRLGFLGINSPEPMPEQFKEQVLLLTSQAGSLDCYGIRTLWLSWKLHDSSYAGLMLQLAEDEGIRQAVTSRFQLKNEHDGYLDEINAEEGLLPVEPEYLLKLLKDGINKSIENNYYLPPDLYACRYLFGNSDLRPAPYNPTFPAELLHGLLDRMSSLLSSSEELLDHPLFEGWLLTDLLVYEIAEGLGSDSLFEVSPDIYQAAIGKLCNELIEPDKQGLLRRLMLIADFMQQSGHQKRDIQEVLALGLSLASSPLPLYTHPFIRRMASDSVEMARQSLAEGFDPRKNIIYEEDDGDWE